VTYNEPVYECACTFIRETDAAVLIDTHEEQLWIPLSQVKEMHKGKNGEGTIVMTAWIAKQKHLL
jgi:hypothetical protein